MRRRHLIANFLGAAAYWPLAAAAQQSSRRRLIATLNIGSEASTGYFVKTFRQALGALGYADEELAIESRWADGYADRLRGLAAELVLLLVAGQSTSALAAEKITQTIPIVFAVSDDPVGIGLVSSLAHPGGNVTGVSFAQEDTVEKQLQLLKMMVPGAHRVAILGRPSNPATPRLMNLLRAAGRELQVEIVEVQASAPERIDPALATARDEHADAIVVLGDGLFTSVRERIVTLAANYHLPAIYHDHIFVESGGLLSYGGDFIDNYRRAAVLIDKILKGAHPADLPVEQPTKFYLHINVKTAKALGLPVPPLLLLQADQLVE
jgi:ABC-type uncharacterized transport system substrate-binding protein